MLRSVVLVGRWLGTAALVILTAVVTAEVIARSLFDHSMEFVEELSGVLLVAITFLAAADSFLTGKFMRIDLLHARLSIRSRIALDRLLAAVAAVFCAGLAVYAASVVRSSYVNGVISTGLNSLPVWIPQCVLLVGTSLLAIACLWRVIDPARPDPAADPHGHGEQ